MEKLGKKITEHRKKLELTQKDLGDMLNVSPQAVSKWENGQAEPDASTMRKLCSIFKISTDELLGIEQPREETAATAATAPAPAQTAPEAPAERVTEQKIINGYCERCKKPVGPGEYVITHSGRSIQHIFCNQCKTEIDKAGRISEYTDHKKRTVKSVIWGAVAGVLAAAGMLVCLLVGDPTFPKADTAILTVVAGVSFFSFIMQALWEGVVTDMFFFFLKSFKMPGVIFTLDLDGLIFLILVKIGGAILGAILSVVFFLIGLIITPLVSVFILPFAAIKRSAEAKKLKRDAQR